jgi:hypothetical protein
MSASNRARVVQKATGLPYTACLKLVTGQRQILPRVEDCLYRDALDDLLATAILRRWAQRTNQVLPPTVLGPDGLHHLDLPGVQGVGKTPARAKWEAAQALVIQDPSLGPQTPLPTPDERLPCDCARCDP